MRSRGRIATRSQRPTSSPATSAWRCPSSWNVQGARTSSSLTLPALAFQRRWSTASSTPPPSASSTSHATPPHSLPTPPNWRRRGGRCARSARWTCFRRLTTSSASPSWSAGRVRPMRAATIREKEIVIEEHPDPVPGTGEVLVRVHAAGLNGADMMQRRGLYPAPPGSPQDIPGMELAGEVLALGAGATRFAEGERVMAIVGGGGQAELATVHERQLMPTPEALDWPSAGGLPEVFTTAHDALFTQAVLRSGERVLVH